MENFEHKCFVCGKTYNYAYNLNKHLRTKHLNNDDDVKFDYRSVVCPLCSKECISKKRLEQHLASHHNCTLETDLVRFFTYESFLKWKTKIEKENVCSFVKCSGSKETNGVKISRFYCHRSGYFSSKGSGKRNQKRLGTNKINGTCPALLKVEENEDGVFVKYVKTHLGHQNDIRRLTLTKEEKHAIAIKLINNTPIDTVLDEFRSSSSDRVERIHLLTRRDILNIKKEFNLCLDDDSQSSNNLLLKERHDAGMKLSYDSILTNGYNEWLVSSETNIGEVYKVKRYAVCTEDCVDTCEDCKYCLHNFVCTCVDSSEQWNMCQHIHLICQYISKKDYIPLADDIENNADDLSVDGDLQNPDVSLIIGPPIVLASEEMEDCDNEHLKSYNEIDSPIQKLKDDMLSLCYDLEKRIQGSESVIDLRKCRRILQNAYNDCEILLEKDNYESDDNFSDTLHKIIKSEIISAS